jgi:hypothetical protein
MIALNEVMDYGSSLQCCNGKQGDRECKFDFAVCETLNLNRRSDMYLDFAIRVLLECLIDKLHNNGWRIISRCQPLEYYRRCNSRNQNVSSKIPIKPNNPCHNSTLKDRSSLWNETKGYRFHKSTSYERNIVIIRGIYGSKWVYQADVCSFLDGGVCHEIVGNQKSSFESECERVGVVERNWNEYFCRSRIDERADNIPTICRAGNIVSNRQNRGNQQPDENDETNVCEGCAVLPPIQGYFTLSFCLKYSPNTALTASGTVSSFLAVRSASNALSMSSDTNT